jgi:hypothetical protein
MLTAIETAVLAEITNKVAAITSSAAQKDARQLLTANAVAVAVLEGTFSQVSKVSWRQDCTVSVLVKFKNMQSEEARRKGINPLVKGIILLLVGQKLGLEIKSLQPKSFKDVTNEEKYTAGVIEYLLEFTTAFYIDKQDDEAVTDLLTVGLTYYLQDPADAVADAADVVAL